MHCFIASQILCGDNRGGSRFRMTGLLQLSDHEGESAEWGKVNTVVKKGKDGRMEIRKEPIPVMPEELAKIANAKIEDLEAGRV